MYKEWYKRTKSIDFVNYKVQKSSQFIIILALIFRVTVLIQQIFHFLLISFCFIGPIGNAVRVALSHHMGHFPRDSHGNLISMDKPENTGYAAIYTGCKILVVRTDFLFILINLTQVMWYAGNSV